MQPLLDMRPQRADHDQIPNAHVQIFRKGRFRLDNVRAQDLNQLSNDFHEAYFDRYSVSEPENDVELVAWRMTATGLVDAPKRPPPVEKQSTNFICKTRFYDSVSQTWQQVPTTDLDNMLESDCVAGPTLLVAKDTTVVIPTGYSAKMASGGYVVISPS